MVGGFLFFGGPKSVRATQPCVCYPSLPAKCFDDKVYSLAECSKACTSSGYASGELAGADRKCSTTPKSALSNAIQNPLAPVAGWVKTAFGAVFVGLLTAVLTFFGWLLSVAAMIFAWAADANSLRNVINNQNIYDSWKIIRDLLNIAFILVLLYTAFTIIFQVDSTGKKIILTVVLMALLVNFSFPITRFIIDIGNSLMYTIFKNLFPEANSNFSNIFSNISDTSGLGKIIDGAKTSGDIPQLIGSIVFVAIMAITFLMMSILFVIRIVALAIIIIFSPVAFVGAAVPSMSSKTGQWWDYLFKYTFFGPAMALMLYIAIQIMKTTQNAMGTAGDGFAPAGTGSLLTGMSTFAIPVVILWIGMGIAQKMGIEGAAMAQKFATKAFKFAALAPAKAGWWGFKKTGVPGGAVKRWEAFKKSGITGSDRTEEREAKIGGFLSKGTAGWNSAAENIKRKRIAAKQKEYEDERLSESEAKLKLDPKNHDEISKKAAALYLSKKDKINDSKTFADAMTALAGDEELQKELRGKAKKDNNIKFVLDYDLAHGIEVEEKDEKTGQKVKKTITDRAQIYEKTLDMSSDDLAKQKSLHDSLKDADKNSEDLQKYIKSIGDKEKGTEYMAKLFEKLTPSNRKIYTDKGLVPGVSSRSQQTSQPKKSYEQTQKEFKQKNDEDMKKPENESDIERAEREEREANQG